MGSLEKNNHDFDSHDRFHPTEEVLERVGIPGRSLTNWVFRGALSQPVLYKGRGGRGFFSERQIEEASVIKRLNFDYKLSITKIKAVKDRIAEDLVDEWPYGDECYLTVFNKMLGFGEAVSAVNDIVAFIDRKKTLVSQPKGTYRFIKTIHHSKKYIQRGGQIRRILYDHEFDKDEYFAIDEIDRCLESQAKILWDSEGEEADKRLRPDPTKWEHKPLQIVELVEKAVMYAPPYFYEGNYYFNRNDIVMTAEDLLKFCHDMGYGIRGGKKLRRRIEEDIQSFFSFSENRLEYSSESILFYKTVKLFGDCVSWLLGYYEFFPKYALYGLDAYTQDKIPSFEQFVRFYLDGLLYVTQDALSDTPLFKVRPLNMMNHKQLSKASKIGLFTNKEIISHLKKRIRFDEMELAELKKLENSLKSEKK